MGVYAMEHGKHVAIEVPAAMTLDEIWKLINTSEKTRKHCMQLENCVYDFFELTSLNMAQQGVFGEVLHVEGSYIHNLEDFWPEYWNNWRMDYNHLHRGDVYATHGMGPACQVLNIHRGDRMKTLVSMDTKAVNGPAYIKKQTGEEVTDFQNFVDHPLNFRAALFFAFQKFSCFHKDVMDALGQPQFFHLCFCIGIHAADNSQNPIFLFFLCGCDELSG